MGGPAREKSGRARAQSKTVAQGLVARRAAPRRRGDPRDLGRLEAASGGAGEAEEVARAVDAMAIAAGTIGREIRHEYSWGHRSAEA